MRLAVVAGYLSSFLPTLPTSTLAFFGLFFRFLGILANAPGLLPLVALQGSGAIHGPSRVLACLLTLGFLEWLLRGRQKSRAQLSTGQLTRRLFLTGAAGGAAGLALTGYGYGVERRSYQLLKYRLALADLPAELQGLRLALLSDWHLGPYNRPEMVARAVELCNQARPDLILLPGDFVSNSGRYFTEVAELIRELHPQIPGGILASWGNHDYWHGIEPGQRLLPQVGVNVLTNQRLLLTPGRELREDGKSGLWLAGLDDLWAGQPDLEAALRGLPPEQPRLVLNHNPDLAETSMGPRVDFMVSGHTHGGQIRIPGLGTPVLPSAYGQKYAAGLVEAPGYPVFVTRGVGTSGLPLRIGVPPEVVIFELEAGEKTVLT